MIFCDDETIYNGNVPSWCPGKLLNFSNGIYIDKDMINGL